MQFLVFFLILISSCDKIEDETDPAKIIQGKWEIIEFGNWPDMEQVPDPGGYDEYSTDSIKIEHSFNPQEVMQKNYWIDSLLHERFYFQEEHRWINTGRYKYEFFDKNKRMRLDFNLGFAEFKTSIWRRI